MWVLHVHAIWQRQIQHRFVWIFFWFCFLFHHRFFFKSLPKGYEDVPFFFWFNTSFVKNMKYEPLVLIFFLCFHFKSWNDSNSLWTPPQAFSTKRRTGQPAQTQDLGNLQARLWCHRVLCSPVNVFVCHDWVRSNCLIEHVRWNLVFLPLKCEEKTMTIIKLQILLFCMIKVHTNTSKSISKKLKEQLCFTVSETHFRLEKCKWW